MLYNFCLLLFYLILTPKLLWERLKGKKHPAFLQRLGFFIPQYEDVIWIHAVSVGEVKASIPFFSLLKEKFPKNLFCITTTTRTGFQEAKKIPADLHFYLPLDFSFAANRFVKKLNPKFLFLIEGDLWPNLLKAVKKSGGKAILVSGKMSERSFSRFSKFPKFTSQLLSHLDLVCVQSEEHAARFSKISKSLVKVTGNLKFDMIPEVTLKKNRQSITIASTHSGEEALILDALNNIHLPLFIAPRHPERFSEVATLLSRRNVSFALFSEKKEARVILVDKMGELPFCFAQSRIAIIGGSFVPGIGGHNFLEPLLYDCPCIFGPYTEKQKEIVSKILEANAGMQVTPEHLWQAIDHMIQDHANYTHRCQTVINEMRGAAIATWNEVIKNEKIKID